MIIPDQKKTVSIILSKLHPTGVPAKEGMGPLHAIAEDLIHSVHSKDAQGVVEALKALISNMEMEEQAQDDEGGGESQGTQEEE